MLCGQAVHRPRGVEFDGVGPRGCRIVAPQRHAPRRPRSPKAAGFALALVVLLFSAVAPAARQPRRERRRGDRRRRFCSGDRLPRESFPSKRRLPHRAPHFKGAARFYAFRLVSCSILAAQIDQSSGPTPSQARDNDEMGVTRGTVTNKSRATEGLMARRYKITAAGPERRVGNALDAKWNGHARRGHQPPRSARGVCAQRRGRRAALTFVEPPRQRHRAGSTTPAFPPRSGQRHGLRRA